MRGCRHLYWRHSMRATRYCLTLALSECLWASDSSCVPWKFSTPASQLDVRMESYINYESIQHSTYFGFFWFICFFLISKFLFKWNNHPEKCINQKGTVDELAQSECTCVPTTQVEKYNSMSEALYWKNSNKC